MLSLQTTVIVEVANLNQENTNRALTWYTAEVLSEVWILKGEIVIGGQERKMWREIRVMAVTMIKAIFQYSQHPYNTIRINSEIPSSR